MIYKQGFFSVQTNNQNQFIARYAPKCTRRENMRSEDDWNDKKVVF